MFLVMSPLLVSALTIFAVLIVLIVLFYFMYHTFHADLPRMMKWILIIGFIIGAILLIASQF